MVWSENWHIVEVFTNCRWRSQIVMGADRSIMVYEGIDAAEVQHCCDLLGVAQSLRREVLWGVRVMESVAKPVLNERQ